MAEKKRWPIILSRRKNLFKYLRRKPLGTLLVGFRFGLCYGPTPEPAEYIKIYKNNNNENDSHKIMSPLN